MMQFIVMDIEPSLLLDSCKETENKVLYESLLGKLATANKA
jgi:hypothetical protein